MNPICPEPNMYLCKLRLQSQPSCRTAAGCCQVLAEFLCASFFLGFHTPEERSCKKEESIRARFGKEGQEKRAISGPRTAGMRRRKEARECCRGSAHCSQVQWVLNSSPGKFELYPTNDRSHKRMEYKGTNPVLFPENQETQDNTF